MQLFLRIPFLGLKNSLLLLSFSLTFYPFPANLSTYKLKVGVKKAKKRAARFYQYYTSFLEVFEKIYFGENC